MFREPPIEAEVLGSKEGECASSLAIACSGAKGNAWKQNLRSFEVHWDPFLGFMGFFILFVGNLACGFSVRPHHVEPFQVIHRCHRPRLQRSGSHETPGCLDAGKFAEGIGTLGDDIWSTLFRLFGTRVSIMKPATSEHQSVRPWDKDLF